MDTWRINGRELLHAPVMHTTLTVPSSSRALLKNLFVQNAAFAAFVFSLHKGISASSDASVLALLPRSEERTLARLIGMSNDIETLQVRSPYQLRDVS